MSEPWTSTARTTRENLRRYNAVDIHESIELLISFTDSIKAKIHEFRTQFKETYKQYLNSIENPQSQTRNHSTLGGRGETNIEPGNQFGTLSKSRNESGQKVQYPSFHKVAKIYDTTMKSLSDFMTIFIADSRDLYSIAIQISSLKQEYDNLLNRNYDRRDDLEANQLYQINKRIENIIENHNKLVINYNAGIEHFKALKHNLSNGILVYESSTGKNFVLSRDDELEEFRRLVETDEVLKKRSSIYATFASRFKSDLQYSADSTVLMPVRPLKKDNWILRSPEQNNDAARPFSQEYQPSPENTEFDDAAEHHVDLSVPNVERGINVQQISQEPMVISPPTPNSQSNYETPSLMIHQSQHYEEAARAKPEDEPLKRTPNLNSNIIKHFQHPRKKTATINYVADKNRDDSQQPHLHTQNHNQPETSNQVHQQSQQNTKSAKAKGDDIDHSVLNVEPSIDIQQTYQQPMDSQLSEELQSSQSTQPVHQLKRKIETDASVIRQSKDINIDTGEDSTDLIRTDQGTITDSELNEILDSILMDDLSELEIDFFRHYDISETGLSPIEIRNSLSYSYILHILFDNNLITPDILYNISKILSKLEEKRINTPLKPHDLTTKLYVSNIDKLISRLSKLLIDSSAEKMTSYSPNEKVWNGTLLMYNKLTDSQQFTKFVEKYSYLLPLPNNNSNSITLINESISKGLELQKKLCNGNTNNLLNDIIKFDSDDLKIMQWQMEYLNEQSRLTLIQSLYLHFVRDENSSAIIDEFLNEPVINDENHQFIKLIIEKMNQTKFATEKTSEIYEKIIEKINKIRHDLKIENQNKSRSEEKILTSGIKRLLQTTFCEISDTKYEMAVLILKRFEIMDKNEITKLDDVINVKSDKLNTLVESYNGNLETYNNINDKTT
ncbi:conserved uncharacterized protein 35a-like protein-5 [Microplitis demolitor]|uniref:conserved uncharacterized protein 35a-like protein-5 n=1 Tax=Microplitis demolitor TaxID=69319 RepID=UPI00044002AC|nr:conserved uncharacterized protein 35a-like protein-5 [Microplitis demolitor]KAG6558396.1 conserved uncharacterized protein 35a-like protein-5 [Microplitis demolitor]